MRTEYISRRLNAVEAKVCPKLTPLKAALVENPAFKRLVEAFELDFEVIRKLPNVFDGFPREALRLIADRLRELERRDILRAFAESQSQEDGNVKPT